MSIHQLAQDYISYVQQGQYTELLNTLYAKDAQSIESFPAPGQQRLADGLDAILQKNASFESQNTVHSHEVKGPWPHGEDKFAVHMSFDMTHELSGTRRQVDEIIVLTVREGKIVKEEFFYGQ